MSGYQSDIIGVGGAIASNVVVIDASNGDDATGVKGNASKPFKTGLAGELAAVSGDVLHFLSGTYLDVNMGKDGIIYYFDAGAKMSNLVDTDPSTFSDAGKGDIQFKIFGDGHFVHERHWNVNNWNIEIITLENNSKVDAEGYKFENIGDDGGVFKVFNGSGEINVQADEIFSGSGIVSSTSSSNVTISARKASLALSFQSGDTANLKLRIKDVYANVPHLFSGFFQPFAIRSGGHLDFEGTVHYNPTLSPNPFTAMVISQFNGGINKGVIRLKGIFNLNGHKWFAFTTETTANDNMMYFEGELNIGVGASDDLFFTNSPGRIVARNLVIKSDSITRTTGIIPAHAVEFHAESTTIVLSAAEKALGSQAIYATAPSNAHLKSFFSNASIDAQVTNLVPNGLVDVNNPNIKE